MQTLSVVCLTLLSATPCFAAEYSVGVARADVTPTYAIRLHGFGFRRTESEGVRQHVWARALAFKRGQDETAIVIAVDNLGVPDELVQELGARLKKKAKLDPTRLAVTATHTHTAPMLRGVAPTIFGMPIVAEEQKRIDRYTEEVADKLEKVALAAIEDLKPAKLSWGIGRVGFAVNRRTKGGLVDHDLPVMVVRDEKDNIRALWVNYACHCVTLSDNKISGDWAGYAAEQIERAYPSATALVSVGCGADSNPSSGVTGAKEEIANEQGTAIRTEVLRLLKGQLRPVTGAITVQYERIDLDFDKHPTRQEFEEKAKGTGAPAYHAKVQLARLDRQEALRTKISYPVQTWAFGDSLALVFLPGEVVVDYSLRLKKELDGRRLWINAYANAAPCYIPSERVLKEGGYEGGGAMIYYDQPARLAPGVEQKIVDAVHKQLGKTFPPPVDPKRTPGVGPMAPEQSLAAMQTKAGLSIELMAAEPLVASPVAIAFGPDGKLWVAEMYDYPLGLDGKFQPGGRVRVLESTKGDGRFDKATVFLDKIPFPTGITVWRKGVLVCAAPDILYAEDTDGDGKADDVKKLYSGFGTGNYQARVNSLEYGLDGWVHGSCGLFGGKIKSFNGKEYALGDRDFRIKPDTGELEPATGRTQQGRVRDDWGNWFGCDNSNLAWHYPLTDHYLRRNPHAAPPRGAVNVNDYADANRLFPIQQQQLFKLSGAPGRTTAACGIGVYRDTLLGESYHGNLYTCEPVNMVVHRLTLSPNGPTFRGRRAEGEEQSEFLASRDGWFRPVQVRTGPDGCLWVVDMYRHVIEHPRWIPPDDVAKLDLRAGHDMGRIYRIRPSGDEPRAWPRLDKLDTAGLVKGLESPNGWQRDMASQMLLWKADRAAVKPLEELTAKGERAEARLHALCVLDSLDALRAEVVRKALDDKHSGVRRHAIRLAERHLTATPDLGPELLKSVDNGDGQVLLQLAFTLGEWKDARAAKALAKLARRHSGDPYLIAAVLSSLRPDNAAAVVTGVFEDGGEKPPPAQLAERLLSAAVSLEDPKSPSKVLHAVCAPNGDATSGWRLAALAGALDALERRGRSLDSAADEDIRKRIGRMIVQARDMLGDEKAHEADRLLSINLLGRQAAERGDDVKRLEKLLVPQSAGPLQSAAVVALGRIADDRAAAALTAGWKGHSPALRGQVLDLLLSRDGWQRYLLTCLEREEILPGDVDLTRRQRLLTHRDEKVRQRAAKLFAGTVSADRKKVIDDYADALRLTGDRTRGKAVFAKSCAACHVLEGVGHRVGPDLAALANKSPSYLLQEILDPNRNLDSRYLQYTAATKAGQTFTGLLSSESATSITLQAQEGKQQVLLRADLDELQSGGKSLMPEGLEKDLTKQATADLIAYLTSAGPPPKKFAGNAPAVVRPVDGALALLATNCEIYGNDIVFEVPYRNVGYWHGAQDHVVWRVELDKEGEFDVWLDWACDNASAGNAFVLEGTQPAVRGVVATTGGWDHYQQKKIGSVTLTAGPHRLTMRPDVAAVKGAMIDLRGIHLVPKGKKPAFAADDPPKPTTLPAIALQILDDKLPREKREALIREHADKSADLVAAMAADLRVGMQEEYRRIPWVWRVSIAAGRRNDATELRKLLGTSLPRLDQELRHWQAVVIGGGIINGVSQQNVWPRERLAELVKDNKDLEGRLRKALAEAAAMADDEKVPTGTRYDALRMIALEGWDKRGEQLAKYLKKGTHDELTMGAISGLSDVDSPKVAPLLLTDLEHFSANNRKLALDALLRTNERVSALLDALEAGKVKPALLAESHVKTLRGLKDEALRKRAEKVLPQ